MSLGHCLCKLLLCQPGVCRCQGVDEQDLSQVFWNYLDWDCSHHNIQYYVWIGQYSSSHQVGKFMSLFETRLATLES